MRGARLLAAIGLAVLVGGTAAANADDAASAATPDIVKPVLDNPRVRVVEVDFKPGSKTAEMSLPDHMLYMLTEGSLVFKIAGKTPYEMTFTAGQALWLPPGTGTLENASDRTVRTLIVELKSGTTVASRPVKRKGRSGRRRRR